MTGELGSHILRCRRRSPAQPGWRGIDAPPTPRRPRVIRWAASNGDPNLDDPAYPRKTAFRFPPRSASGVFLFSGMSLTKSCPTTDSDGVWRTRPHPNPHLASPDQETRHLLDALPL